jgi:hypothetical protein
MVLNIETSLKQLGINNTQSLICSNKIIASSTSDVFNIDGSIFSLANLISDDEHVLDFNERFNFNNIKSSIVGIIIFCYKKDVYPDIIPIDFNIELVDGENSIELKLSNFQMLKINDIGFNNIILSDFDIASSNDSCLLDIILLVKTDD